MDSWQDFPSSALNSSDWLRFKVTSSFRPPGAFSFKQRLRRRTHGATVKYHSSLSRLPLTFTFCSLQTRKEYPRSWCFPWFGPDWMALRKLLNLWYSWYRLSEWVFDYVNHWHDDIQVRLDSPFHQHAGPQRPCSSIRQCMSLDWVILASMGKFECSVDILRPHRRQHHIRHLP